MNRQKWRAVGITAFCMVGMWLSVFAAAIWGFVPVFITAYAIGITACCISLIRQRDAIRAALGSDAHTEQKDTGTTGWHRHLADHTAHLDNRCDCSHRLPVLVVDPAEARDTIAVRLAVEFHEEPYFGHSTDADSCFACADILDAVLAALAGQVQP